MDLQSALQTIAARAKSREIFNGVVQAIEQLADMLNDLKALS